MNPKEEGFDSQYFKNVSVIISDTTYIKLLPDNLSNTRNRYKVMCGYEIRISISMIQSGLNTWRLTHIYKLKGVAKQNTSRISVKYFMKGMTNTSNGFIHWINI